MKLLRLRVEQFRRFRAPFVIEDLSDGINLFEAPNEAGKSTLAEAIRAAFFERHRSSSVEHLRPWGDAAATPTVELAFEHGGRHYQLTKAFLGRRRCDLQIDSVHLEGAAAEDHLAALLGFGFPGKGASTPAHMGIPGLLWIRQGTSHELGEAVAHAAGHLRQVLGAAVGDLASSGGDALLRAVENARNELLTPANANPRGAYADALHERERLQAQRSDLATEIDAYRASVDRLASLRSAHGADARERPWDALRERHAEACARLEAARGLAARQAQVLAGLQQLRTQVQGLRDTLDALARTEAAVPARARALADATAAAREAQAGLLALEQQHAAVAQADTAAQRQLAAIQARAVRLQWAQSAADLEASCREGAEVLARARAQHALLVRLQGEAAALAIAPALMQALREAADGAREAGVRLDAVATTLDFDLLGGCTVDLDGETLGGAARRTVARRTQIDVAGVGRITVTPGGADLERLAAARDRHLARRDELLAGLALPGLAQAEERMRQAAQRVQEAGTAAQLLETLAPQGLEALEAAQALRTARLEEIRTHMASLPPEAAADDTLPSLTEAQALAGEVRARLESVTGAVNRARVAAGAADSLQSSAATELAAAEASVGDPQHQQRKAAATQALTDALAQEAAAQRQADTVAAELQRVNLTLLQQDVERLADSARALEQAHLRRAEELSRLEGELDSRGALGLEEQQAAVDGALGQLTRRIDETARRAAALDYLLELLRDKRSALARRLVAPLQQHLDHFLQILFPGARIEVAPDLSPGPLTRPGASGPETGTFEALSVGAREQMGLVARLAYADLLQAAGRPTLLILDDALVHTDSARLGQMKRVLYDAAARHQILIFTCHPAAWRDLGVPARTLPA